MRRLLLLALLGLWICAPRAAIASKPNILVIYSDDHGWADLGAQGVNGDIRTPNLDQLARNWREAKVQLPAEGRVTYLRLTPVKASAGLKIQSIELRGASGSAQTWRFDQPR